MVVSMPERSSGNRASADVLTVCAVQLPACTMDLEANTQIAEAAVRAAAAATTGATLILLPEMALLPYFCGSPAERYRHWAQTVDGPLAARFSLLARQNQCAILLPFYEIDRANGCFHNAVMGFDAGGYPLSDGAIARKLHLPVGDEPAPGYDEKAHFTPGNALHLCEIYGWKVGVLICYDRRFPECWRALRAAGAELVAVPVAGSGGDDLAFFVGELRTHARENGLAVICANKVGDELIDGGTVDNYGESIVIDAAGDVLAYRARAEGPGLVMSELHRPRLYDTRKALRYFDDRRVDLYGDVATSWIT